MNEPIAVNRVAAMYNAGAPTLDAMLKAIDLCAMPDVRPNNKAVWVYHHDEHGTWWGCAHCGKVCRKNPHDKRYCSRCGSEMRMEA